MPPDEDKDKKLEDKDFDFIWSSPAAIGQKKRWLSKKKLLIIGLLLSALLFLGALILLQVHAKNELQQKNRLTQIIKLQKEISRISYNGIDKVSENDTERVSSINKKMDEDIETTRSLLANYNVEIGDEDLSGAFDESVDKQLEDAEQFNNYDKVFNQALNTKLTDYQRVVLETSQSASGDEYSTLNSYYDEANSMLGLTDESE